MKYRISKAVKTPTDNSGGGNTRMQWIITFAVNMTALSFGLQTCWPTCVARVLQSDTSPTGSAMSTIDISWLVSIPLMAAMTSVPGCTYLVDKVGRKPCILICAVLHIICWLITYLAANMVTLIIALVVSGLGGGFSFYVTPMYIKEISQDDLRGALGLVMITFRNIGVLFIYLMGGEMEYYSILYVALAVAVATVLIVLKLPESPTFYMKIGQVEAAALTIANIRNLKVNDRDVQNAIDSIKAEDEKFKSIENVTFFGIFKEKAWCRGFMCGLMLMICHGLNGGLSLLTFTPTILEMIQVTVKPELQGLSVPIFMIIGSLLSMVLIERLGRKPILVTAFVVSTLSFAALTAVVVIKRGGGGVPEWATLVILVIPVLGFASALSPLPYVVMAEIFNFQIRAKVMGVLVMCGWASGFSQTLLFGQLTSAFGPQGAFAFSSIVNLIGTVLCLILVPETRGKSVAEIEMELEKIL